MAILPGISRSGSTISAGLHTGGDRGEVGGFSFLMAIPAILGALIMQSLQSGMAMVGVDAPYQNIVVGIVLVIAVLIDIIYRRRTGD